MSTGLVITLFVLGIVLLILEIFVPGGILGFIGIISLITGIVAVSDSLTEAILYILGMLLALGVIIFLSFRSKRTRGFWRRFSLSTRQVNSEGYVAPKREVEKYLGKTGTALTQLRPSGTADFEGDRVDVVTEGGFIRADSKIKVIAVEGTRVIVREES